MNDTVSIVCVTHARPELVLRCMQSCVEQDYSQKEIVLLFNPDDSTTEATVRARFPAIRILKTHRNLGFFPALNLAMANCDSDYVMIVDDDAWFLAPDALSRLVQHFRDEPELGAVTCNLEGPNEQPITGGDRYIRVFTTGFTMIPHKVFSEWVGPVPDLFFRSAGETYWCSQLWEQRRPVKRVAAVRMFHALAQQGRSTRDWRFYGLRSQFLCAVMREPALCLGPVLFSKFVKSFMQCVKRRQPVLWLHAWFSFLLHLPEAFRFRRPISLRTWRLLQRLDRSPVRSLSELAEWTCSSDGATDPLPAKRRVT